MEHRNIIYEKRFSHPTIADEGLFDANLNESTVDPIEQDLPNGQQNSPDRCQKLLEEKVNILIPDRVMWRESFVEAAKNVAESYEVDTSVVEYENRLVASFRVDCDIMYSGLKFIILLADDIGFQFDNEGIVFDIIYYTHATYVSGRKISPNCDTFFDSFR